MTASIFLARYRQRRKLPRILRYPADNYPEDLEVIDAGWTDRWSRTDLSAMISEMRGRKMARMRTRDQCVRMFQAELPNLKFAWQPKKRRRRVIAYYLPAMGVGSEFLPRPAATLQGWKQDTGSRHKTAIACVQALYSQPLRALTGKEMGTLLRASDAFDALPTTTSAKHCFYRSLRKLEQAGFVRRNTTTSNRNPK